jgi:acyl-CoA thioester hydrolase
MKAQPAAELRTVAQAGPASEPAAGGNRVLVRVMMAVRWGDLDAFNHVNNAAFLDYVQEARLTWITALDGAKFDEGTMPVVAATHVNFRRQLAWPANVSVELTAGRIGDSSVTISHRITAADDSDLVYADGEAVLVWIERASGQSIPLPAVVRAACQSPLASAATTSK